MNMTQKVLTRIFESLLNTAAQAPTDDIVNRDGISLMKQGFELIMQAHREGGATGPTSPLLADARQLLADVEALNQSGMENASTKERTDESLAVDEDRPITLRTIAMQLSSMSAQLEVQQRCLDAFAHVQPPPINIVAAISPSAITAEEGALAISRELTGLKRHPPASRIVIQFIRGVNSEDLFYRDLEQLAVKWGNHLHISPPLSSLRG
ncbi:hypothetical protein O8E93_003624 [Aeromonas salmonicida]|nr:hypothetical protein [Aeromonas salmonicida]